MKNADADADADVNFSADAPRMRMRMRMCVTSLPFTPRISIKPNHNKLKLLTNGRSISFGCHGNGRVEGRWGEGKAPRISLEFLPKKKIFLEVYPVFSIEECNI